MYKALNAWNSGCHLIGYCFDLLWVQRIGISHCFRAGVLRVSWSVDYKLSVVTSLVELAPVWRLSRVGCILVACAIHEIEHPLLERGSAGVIVDFA